MIGPDGVGTNKIEVVSSSSVFTFRTFYGNRCVATMGSAEVCADAVFCIFLHYSCKNYFNNRVYVSCKLLYADQ